MKRIVTGCAVIGLGLVLAATHAEAAFKKAAE